MNEPFELPITYKGEDLLLPAQLLNYGYTHKFKVKVNEQEVLFEPDEERVYRALIDTAYIDKMKEGNKELLQVIAEALQSL